MNTDTVRSVNLCVQIIVVLLLLLRSLRLMRASGGALPAVMYAFVMVTMLVSDLYWLALTLMRPGYRPAFMPSEIGDDSVLLLIGSVVTAAFRGRRERTTGLICAAVLFAAVNTALWIGWTGEWVKDILGGLALCYLLAACARGMALSGALRRGEWAALGVLCAVLAAAQTAIFFCPQPLARGLDAFCYALLFGGTAGFFIKVFLGLRSGAPAEMPFAVAFGGLAWCLCALYMCSEPMWFVADALLTVMMVAAFRALERQVSAA